MVWLPLELSGTGLHERPQTEEVGKAARGSFQEQELAQVTIR